MYMEISNDDVNDADDFTVVGNAIGGFINTHITGSDVGVLVAHNGCCDFAFLFSMFQRYKLDFPESLMYTLDTLEHIRRFKIYNDVQLAEWPELTKTGRRSMTVSNICNWIIKRDDIDGTFESLYGGKHEALADARAALQVLTDDDGCWSRIGEHKEVFKILMDEENYWNQMVEKLKEPVIKHEEISVQRVGQSSEEAMSSLLNMSRKSLTSNVPPKCPQRAKQELRRNSSNNQSELLQVHLLK